MLDRLFSFVIEVMSDSSLQIVPSFLRKLKDFVLDLVYGT